MDGVCATGPGAFVTGAGGLGDSDTESAHAEAKPARRIKKKLSRRFIDFIACMWIAIFVKENPDVKIYYAHI